MKFLVLSDLHLEFAEYAPPRGVLEGVDAVILAGDTMPNCRKLPAWATKPSVFGPDVPILIVLGNHEFYGGQIEIRRRELQAAAAAFSNVHVLDPGEVLLDGERIRVLGCTLWTDFALPIQTRLGLVSDRARALKTAAECMNDYGRIKIAEDERREDRAPTRFLKPNDTLALHAAERTWLHAKLAQPFSGETVVVTHHGPSAGSVAPRWAGDWLSPAFSSDLPAEFFDVPTLWIHGHTHDSRDYRRRRSRVLCNPRGYLQRTGRFENDNFDPAMVIEV
jgi:predicted phosphodiesterase